MRIAHVLMLFSRIFDILVTGSQSTAGCLSISRNFYLAVSKPKTCLDILAGKEYKRRLQTLSIDIIHRQRMTTKRRLHDRKTEHFKALTQDCHASALGDHVISTGQNIKWDHFEIIATGKSDLQCKIKETLLISELKPSLNENVGSEKLFLY